MYDDIERLKKIKELYEKIDLLALEVLKTCKVDAPVKDIEYIVSCFGGSIKEANCLKYISKTGYDSFDIYVRDNRYPLYNKFYIAARLGDVLLHTNYLLNKEEYLKSDVFEFKEDDEIISQEDQSYEFAYGLLMPKDLYKEVFDKYKDGDIVLTDNIAKYFDVTVSMASSRGKRLGLIK